MNMLQCWVCNETFENRRSTTTACPRHRRVVRTADPKMVLSRERSRSARAAAPEGYRWCARCASYSPASNFGPRRTAYCKPCMKSYLHHRSLERIYGISSGEYLVMLARQRGGCGICGAPPSGKKLAVDHCHETGKIRGLLCTRCNQTIGAMGDDVALLMRAIEYLGATA